MSLGHYSSRTQKLLITFGIGTILALSIGERHPMIGIGIAAVAGMLIAYQIGRAIENGRMKKRKWYSEDNYDRI